MVTFQTAMRKPTTPWLTKQPTVVVAHDSLDSHRCPKCKSYDPHMIDARYSWIRMIARDDGYKVVFTRKPMFTPLCSSCRLELNSTPKTGTRYTAH